jgi:hypothetical protein
MLKGKFVVLSLIAAALLCWQVTGSVETVSSGIVNPCSSTASGAGACYLVCPQGDGDRLDAVGSTISVTVRDNLGAPIPNVPAADFWLIGCNDALALCGGSGSINADSASNGAGNTTISGDLAAGGCDDGLQVVVQGVVIADPNDWTQALCLAVLVRSPDINADLVVDLIDFSLFGPVYNTSPAADDCIDFNCDGVIDLVDFSLFGNHYLHLC